MTDEAALLPVARSVRSVPRFVVPRTNQSVLAIPERDQLPRLAAENARALSAIDLDLQGISLKVLRRQVRAGVLERAVQYTGSIVEQPIETPQSGPLIVTGHQPELFHAGVWAKNFATSGVALRSSGLALNLIIDNDTVTGTQLRIPSGTPTAPSIEWIPYDTGHPQQPWEESPINDLEYFTGFGSRAFAKILDRWKYQPLIGEFWPDAVRQAVRSRGMSDCLSAVRIAAERSMGLQNLEVPMSQVCSDQPFCRFAAYLMAHLPRFHRVYNEAVRDYRQVHKLRSSTHPVPELEIQGEWLEAPFWIWRPGDVRRDRPFLRTVGSEVELRDRTGWCMRLPISPEGSLEAAAVALVEFQKSGIRLRTRALTTTLFLRVFLADLFVHGIGGAKYDAMTDVICRNFLGIPAPEFATVSATLYLPLAEPYPETAPRQRAIRHAIRDCKYNPDRQLNDLTDGAVQSLIEEKQRMLMAIAGRRPTRTEHLQLERLNRELGKRIETQKQNLFLENEMLRSQAAANAIFQNREFSWCLHPRSSIQAFMEREFLAHSR